MPLFWRSLVLSKLLDLLSFVHSSVKLVAWGLPTWVLGEIKYATIRLGTELVTHTQLVQRMLAIITVCASIVKIFLSVSWYMSNFSTRWMGLSSDYPLESPGGGWVVFFTNMVAWAPFQIN